MRESYIYNNINKKYISNLSPINKNKKTPQDKKNQQKPSQRNPTAKYIKSSSQSPTIHSIKYT